jgi:hypothetical protein
MDPGEFGSHLTDTNISRQLTVSGLYRILRRFHNCAFDLRNLTSHTLFNPHTLGSPYFHTLGKSLTGEQKYSGVCHTCDRFVLHS